jgi:hypothetical protein
MFRIKAIAALALAGLGGATMGTDAYLASHHRTASEIAPHQSEASTPVVAATKPAPAATSTVVTLEPITLTSRAPARHHAAPRMAPPPPVDEQEFVPCSDWRSLETGPADRGVRTLCVRDVTPQTQ